MRIRCIIVDDEPLIRELLADNLGMIPFMQLIHACQSAAEALDVLQREPVDVIFLDVHMPQISGFQLLASLGQPPIVIMITAYEQYAVEAFNLRVADYILKPFSFERFLKACNRAAEMYIIKKNTLKSLPADEHHFFVNVEYTLVKIISKDILYIAGLKDYIQVHLVTGVKPVLTRMSMKAVETKLPINAFVRTHKSFLVAISRITVIKRDCVCVGAIEIPVSETFREHVNRIARNV